MLLLTTYECLFIEKLFHVQTQLQRSMVVKAASIFDEFWSIFIDIWGK